MSEMVERVARAMSDAGCFGAVTLAFTEPASTDTRSIGEIRKYDTDRALSAVRVAFAAMREPTPDMVGAGNERAERSTGETSLTIWWAMIDAALKP